MPETKTVPASALEVGNITVARDNQERVIEEIVDVKATPFDDAHRVIRYEGIERAHLLALDRNVEILVIDF